MVKVSVIIPVYNVEKYLPQCLDSIINQTLKEIEILCINDGSKDESLNILQDYANKDKRITVIDKMNEGVGITRNKGIELAKGEFVAFIDPDDIYPDKDILENLYDNAIKNNVYICGGEFSEFNDGTFEFKQDYHGIFDGYLFKEDGIIEYSNYQFDYGYHRFIYNKKFLQENNIFFPNYKRFQDPPFFVNAMIKAKKFYAMHKISYAYRIGHSHISWNEEKVLDMLQGVLDNFKYAKTENLNKLKYYTYRHCKAHSVIYNFFTFKVILKLISIVMIEPKMICMLLNMLAKKIFSIKKEGTHKIITIVGIKIKIRRKNA